LIYNLIKTPPLFFTWRKLRPPGIGTEATDILHNFVLVKFHMFTVFTGFTTLSVLCCCWVADRKRLQLCKVIICNSFQKFHFRQNQPNLAAS